MFMKDFLAIMINKCLSFACFILKPIFKKDGSVTPGYYASKLNKNILDDLKFPKYVIGVTGSSGKGSTTSLVAHILSKSGYKVVWNKNGSNLYNAAVTLILNHTNPFTKNVNADILLMELDESFISKIFKKNKLTHLVVTNITRDQPARNGFPDLIYEKIASSIDDTTTLIINADDPIVSRLKLTNKKIITYGIDKTKYDIKKPISNNVDAAYCPKCEKKLKYTFYHYGHIGSYTCPNCKFSARPVDYLATDVDLDKSFMLINDTLVHLNKNVFFCCYYTLAAYALTKTIEVSENDILRELNEDIIPAKRMKSYRLGKREIEMIESKNENSLSYLQTINYIRETKYKKTIIIGFDNVSRRYAYNDLSWLYDVDFELLNIDSIDKIFCIGRFRYDVYTRLIYAGIDKSKLILIDDENKLLDEVNKKSKGRIITMVCFDMTEKIKNMLLRGMYEDD